MRVEEPLDLRGVALADGPSEAGGQVGRQRSPEGLQGPDHPIDVGRQRLTVDRRGPAGFLFLRIGQRGRERGEPTPDRLAGRRQVAGEFGISQIPAGRVAEPGGLRGDRLVERPERGEQRPG